jgi:gamma-tubulin complex component 3
LVRIFIQKFKFKENIEALNKYLLLGQGDMIQNLMESLYTELQKPGNTIYKYVLQSILESAINSTNARYNDKECLNKLNIKLLKALPGDIGWDVFCLEYNIELPLNNIISSRNLLDYQKMFIFLIKIKRIEYSQNLEWRKIMTYTRDIPSTQYPFFKSKIKKSLQFNQQIMHFIISLHNYLTLEVLETQYKKLIKQIHNVNSIDELISAHNEFVNNIKQKCFLDNKNNNNILIYKKIISIFDIILRFRTAQDVLISTLLQKVNDLDEKEKSLNSQNLDEDESEINYNNRIEESIKQISFLYEEFTNKIIELINNMNNFGLYYLAMKLDFNYYYSNVEKEKDEKEQQILIEKINNEQNRIKIEKQKMKQNLYKDIEYNKNLQNNNNIQNYSIQNNNEINEYNEYISKDNEKNNDINEDDINPNYNININNNMIYNNLTKNLYNKYTNNNYNYNNINNYNDTNENQNIENINKNYPENNNYDYNYKDEEDMGNEGMEEDDQNDDSNIN